MRIIAATGSSAGHIFPAVSFLEALAERDTTAQTLLLLPKRSKGLYPVPAEIKIRYISVTPVALKINFNSFIGLFNFLKGALESLLIIAEFKPDVVVGFGSLDSFWAVFFAWLFRIKTVIHEQNVSPGRANKLLAKIADKVTISFERTKDYLKIEPEKIVFTGNLLRCRLKKKNKEEAAAFLGLSDSKFTILVCGGSQGSRRINQEFLGAFPALKNKFDLQVIHICGAAEFKGLNAVCQGFGAGYKLFAFLDEIQYAYSLADLAVCRAGANTITELIRFKLPALIIPYPFALGHQLANALVLKESKCVAIMDEKELCYLRLGEILGDFLACPHKIELMRANYSVFPESRAPGLLVDEVINLNA
jgi:UDP-N-acetylglucosamine--N-acetylmuramyl-(pentapeptide) pyrophosphoryl-undecaprenol N-acetylglucosamine transferase